MKKFMGLLLVAALTFSLTACGNQTAGDTTEDTTTVASESTTPETVETQSEVPETETEVPETETPETEVPETEAETEVAEAETTESSVLVVFFSNTGNTRAIAESIASGLDADLYEIIAEVPYTADDLNYNDNNSRSTLEMNDATSRPAISGSVENMDQYDTVYIGYPIWWGEAPRIVSTFVETYDFAGKTVIPFCTSASSGVGSSATRLAEQAGSGEWADGHRFSGSESADEVMEWVNGL